MYIILTFSMAGIIVGYRYIDFLLSKYEYIFLCQTALLAVVFGLKHFSTVDNCPIVRCSFKTMADKAVRQRIPHTVILHLTNFVRCRITIPMWLFSVLQLCLP